MRKHDPIRLTALRMLKTALTNREVERGRALATRSRRSRRRPRQAAQGFHRTVYERRAPGSRRQGSGRDPRPRSVPAATGGPGRRRTGRDRRHRGNRRHLAERHGPGDESGDGKTGRPERRRQDRERARPAKTGRRVNLLRCASSKTRRRRTRLSSILLFALAGSPARAFFCVLPSPAR